MFIRKTSRKYKNKTYTNYFLVESYSTPSGPRQRVICSLGSLEPGPKEKWLELSKKLEAALSGQLSLEGIEEVDARVREIVEKVKVDRDGREVEGEVEDETVEAEKAREGGSVYVGHKMWERLNMDGILKECGIQKRRSRRIIEMMVMNRLIRPLSEMAMPKWINRTALEDILNIKTDRIKEDTLYRTMDKIYPVRGQIESKISQQEEGLFNLDTSIYLYDLTSTYFEGECVKNPQAKYGYSRDNRSDCKQVVVGLVVDREGFPKIHEVFEGDRTDNKTVGEILDAIEKRIGKREGVTVVVDRGMANEESLEEIKGRGYHYMVALRQGERTEWLDEFEDELGWQKVIRKPSPTNPSQKKSEVIIKSKKEGETLYVLCVSEGRKEKDKAIREREERRLLADIKRLENRIEKGKLKDIARINQAIGRLKERYPEWQGTIVLSWMRKKAN